MTPETELLLYSAARAQLVRQEVVPHLEKGFVVIVCRACAFPSCTLVCPTEALLPRQSRGIRLDLDRCIGCGLCVKACPFGAIFWNDEVQKPMICIHCGYCVRYCPHGVLAIDREVSHVAK